MGLFSGVGGFLNDITGASSAQGKQYQQSKALSDRSYAQQKEFAQNQVQWYADDLEKAGFNRALSTGASSVGSGGATSGSTSAPTAGLDLLGGIVGAINQTRQTNADTKYKDDLGQAAIIQAMAAMEQAGVKVDELKGGALLKALGKDFTSAMGKRWNTEVEGFKEMFKDGWNSFFKEMKRQAKKTFSR